MDSWYIHNFLLVYFILILIGYFLHIESRDLDDAMKKIEAFANENMKLKSQLMELIERLEDATRETTDLKLLKTAAMDMVS